MATRRLVVAIGLVLALSFLIASCGGSPADNGAANGSGEEFVQAAGEIFLEPAGTAGPDSFAGDTFVTEGTVPSPTITSLTTVPSQGPVQVASVSGGTLGLYGGSKNKLIVDKAAQLEFLRQNLDKAAAFCAALNSDPTLRWSGGTQVTPAQLPDYFAELTPMLLTRDVRVTNHGYHNGKPTPRQSILQAGQLVLVDRFGVPRTRAECGNPLIPPIPVPTKPKYTGTPWPTFDPSTVIVIQQTTVIIDTFVLIDVDTGQTFERPAGTSGESDGVRGSSGTTVPPTTATTLPATTTTLTTGSVAPEELSGPWTGSMTITDIVGATSQGGSDQGCSPAELEAIKDKPLPMTLAITMDESGTGGTATFSIDVSAIDPSATSEPTTLTFTYDGHDLVFDIPADQAQSVPTVFTGVASRQGQTLVINGTMVLGDLSSEGAKAVWQATK